MLNHILIILMINIKSSTTFNPIFWIIIHHKCKKLEKPESHPIRNKHRSNQSVSYKKLIHIEKEPNLLQRIIRKKN